MAILALTFSTSFLIFLINISAALDTITPSQSLRDGETLVSRGGRFELGFFSPGSSMNHYLGIWYKNIRVRTVVWVANRQSPISESSGLLVVNSTGSLMLCQNRTVVWSSNSRRQAQYPVVELLDTGNLVVRDSSDGNSDDYVWQSFDYPSDTLLPGMKLGWDLRTGLNRHLSAWKNENDPSLGDFTWGIELQNNPELVMWKGSQKIYRSGPWNGVTFSGAPELRSNPVFDYNFVLNEEEIYYTYNLKDNSSFTRIVLNQTNYVRQRYSWDNYSKSWILYATVPRDYCDNYGLCGAYGNCIITSSPVCQCLEGFEPNSTTQLEWSRGCARKNPLNCSNGDGFIKFSGLKLPDAASSWVNSSMNLRDCRAKCSQNCSCMAYTNTDIRDGGSGCALWFGNLIDMREFSTSGQDLYIRMSSSDIGAQDEHRRTTAVIVPIVIAAVFGTILVSYYICKKRARLEDAPASSLRIWEQGNQGQTEDLELPLVDLATIAKATNNFAYNNKLGEGGFGPVYKGTLTDGQEIAVKRLSISSGQGLQEFKNEVKLIAKLQHRNLVRLLGCCIQGEEKMLIYEYMPNKSLDSFIFDQTRAKLLDWSKRFNIICGIARGLLYLHQDSRLRIIHRDLKASNVLLDHDLNPKISDFGMARTFGGDQGEGNTNRVVGTYGYMAPEYAIDGLFSVKSDVFSFGILMMEIISGIKNRGFYHPSHSHNLMEHAWTLWKEDKPLELVDSWLKESCIVPEVTRCIHISLLCVQQYPEDRPNMSSVILMLGGESALTEPKQPGFFKNKKSLCADSSTSKHDFSSTNEVTITLLEAR